MASPTKYVLTYDFTAFQTSNPSTPLPADKLEIQFNNLQLTTDEIIDTLGLIQKSDGTLANGIVKIENLAPELTIGLASPTSWSNGAVYAVNDTVIEANKLYRCLVAHTGGVFATDLAALKWEEVADYAIFIVDAEAAKDAAETAQAAAEAAQVAAETAYDDFDDRYLGDKASDPTLDNDGNALLTGALYWNTTSSEIKVYSGSAWGAAVGATSLPIFVYTASGGETSVSGPDDNTNTLAYTPTKVQVFINGSNETQNVVATTGTSITSIASLSASDVVEIYAFDSVVVLNDIISHTTATPTKDDFGIFADVDGSNLDRKATLQAMLTVAGYIAATTAATPVVADEFLFSDTGSGGVTRKASLQRIVDLVPASAFVNTDITGQTDTDVAATDQFIFTDTSDGDALKKDTIQGVIDLAQDVSALDTVTPAATDLILLGDVSDANNPKKATITDVINTAGISQGGLNTSTGSFSKGVQLGFNSTFGANDMQLENYATAVVTLPGGQYGFTVRSDAQVAGRVSGWIMCNDTTSLVAGAMPFRYFLTAASETVFGDQLYVTSSPPFDMGDGEVGGFFYVLVDKNGDIQGHYMADVPPWGYNGPTSVMACRQCPKTGKKFNRIMKERTLAQILDGAPVEMIEREITHNVKNADMGLIPHPFGANTGDLTPVLIDPMSDGVRKMIDYQNAGGQEVKEYLKRGAFKIGNEGLIRKGPQGILQVPLIIK